MRFGICGTGSFGRTRAKALKSLDGAEVTLGWSRSAETRTRFSEELGCATAQTWQGLCESPQIDAVLICTPNSEHFTQACAALGAGKHVLVETPLTFNAAQAHELADLAAKRKLVLHHGAKWRYHPGHAEYIAQFREVGQLLFGIAHYSFDFGPQRSWYSKPTLCRGGRDFLPYVMLNWLEAFGPVQRAAGSSSRTEAWSAAAITLDFQAGGYITVSYAIGLNLPEINILQLVGTAGTIQLSEDGSTMLIKKDVRQALQRADVDIVKCECQAFYDEILGRRDHREYLKLDLQALKLVDEAIADKYNPDDFKDDC